MAAKESTSFGLDLIQIKERRAALLDTCEAVNLVAQGAERELTSDESDEIDRLMIEFNALAKREAQAQAIEDARRTITQERNQAALTKNRNAATVPESQAIGAPVENTRITPVGSMRRSSLKCFAEPEMAAAAGHWFKAVLAKNEDSRKWCVENSNNYQGGLGFRPDNYDPQMVNLGNVTDVAGQGGLLVPVLIAQAILDVRDRVGVIAGNAVGGVTELGAGIADSYPLNGSDDTDYPKDDSGLGVYGVDELTTITDTELALTSVPLRAKDKYTLTRISNTLLRNRPDFAGDWISQRIGHAFGLQMDIEGILGDGVVGAPHYGITGLQTALGAAGKIPAPAGAWTNYTDATLGSMIAALDDKFFIDGETCWLCSRSFFNTVFRPLINARGGSKADMEGATGLMFEGYPVKTSDRMPKSYVATEVPLLFGNFRKSMVVGDRENLSIAADASVYFHQDAVAVRGKQAYDMNVHRGGDGANIGGYVGLLSAVP